ncbi:ankyrin repeat domain-containing protein [bacterium]|nr:ankyrin repeat domain-containing protein [bacterium]
MKPRTYRGNIVRFCLLWTLFIAASSAIASPKTLPHFPMWPTFDYGLGKLQGNREIQKLGPNDELFLWRVDGENSTVYLMGSIHLLKKSSYPLAPLYEYVYDECNQLVVETNESGSDEHNEYLMNKMQLGGNKKLSHYISSSAYNWIQDLAIDNDLPADFFNQFKPEAVGLFIAQIKAENYGYDFTLGVDFHFIDKAEDDFIPIYSLEGVERYDLFFTGSLAKQTDELEDFINEIKKGKAEKELTELVDSWLNDYDRMVKYLLANQKKDKKDNDISLKTRNIAWVPEIEKYIKQGNATLVIGGAAHFFGDYGVVKLLEKKGYKVNQLHNVVVPSISFESAIDNGNLKIMNEYLPFHPNLNLTLKGYENWGPMHEASSKGTIDSVKFLIGNGAKVDVTNQKGYTPLHLASLLGRFNIAELLIENGADVNTEDNILNTPLHNTAQLEEIQMMHLLIENGANIDIRNKEDGWTPLHNAATGGKVKSIELLLQNGAEINAKSFIGETPLHFAAEYGHKEAVEILVTNGALVTIETDKGKTAYDISVDNSHALIAAHLKSLTLPNKTLIQSVKDNDIVSIKRHIKEKSDLNQTYVNNETALHRASEMGLFKIASLLVDGGSSVEAINKFGETPLHQASKHGHLNIVQLLINNHSKIDIKQIDKLTPLHFATIFGHLEISRILIKNSADINAENKNGKTPLHFASKYSHLKIAELLISNGAKINAKDSAESTPLHWAADAGNTQMVEFLIDNGCEINAENLYGKTPISVTDKEEVIITLIDRGAEFDKKVIDKLPEPNLSIQQAALFSTKQLKLHLLKGTNVDVVSIDNWTALHYTSLNNRVSRAELLLSNGASTEIRLTGQQYHSMTAIHIAVMSNNTEMVKLLIRYGANYKSLTSNGETPLDIAIRMDNQEIEQFIKNQYLIISSFKYSGQFQFDINGMEGATFLIEASADLKLWSPIGEFKNRDGVVKFSDRTSPLFGKQFYRVKVVE